MLFMRGEKMINKELFKSKFQKDTRHIIELFDWRENYTCWNELLQED